MRGLMIWLGMAAMSLCVGCTTTIGFGPHPISYRSTKAPAELGLYYTTGTLTQVYELSRKETRTLTKLKIVTGQALESEVYSRLRPRVRGLSVAENPFPEKDVDLVIVIGIERFDWQGGRANVVLTGQLIGPHGAVLIDKKYPGRAGTLPNESQLEQTIQQGTREAFSTAINAMIDEMEPFWKKIEAGDGASSRSAAR
jgi:hypothetical protein